MADAPPYDTFISYAHEDMAFAALLNASLKLRRVNAWRDDRLQPAQLWQSMIDNALANSRSMILINSQASHDSSAVQYEYNEAHGRKLRIFPVRYTECSWWTIEQGIDVADVGANEQDENVKRTKQVASALKSILFTLLNPALGNLGPRELYDVALEKKRSDDVDVLEEAATILQHIVDENPDSSRTIVELATIDLQKLTETLYPYRLKRLFEDAMAAHQSGDYNAEVGALRARLALGHEDDPTYRWADDYLGIAKQNAQQTDAYESARKAFASGNLSDARNILRVVWNRAPYYRDPVGIAPALGLPVPPSYEETKEREAADKIRSEVMDRATRRR